MTASLAVQCVGRLAITWLAAVAAAFLLIRLMPGDPIEIFLAQLNTRIGPEIIAAYQAKWGLDSSLLSQFLIWLTGFLTFDWGVSFETGQSVASDFAARLPYSVVIGAGGMVLALIGGYILGFLAALKPGGWIDNFSRALAIFGQAVPAFAAGLLLLWVLGVQLRWISAFGGGPLERVLLPLLLVALFSLGSISRLVRSGFVEVRHSPYFRTALAKGRSQAEALWFHGRAASALTLVAGLAPELAWIIGGTAVAEIVFGVPGLSERVVQAVNNRDYAVLQPYVSLVALWVIVVLQGAHMLRHSLDPRLV